MFDFGWNYYKGTTSAGTILKDISTAMCTAVKYNEIKRNDKVLRPKEVFIEKNWDIVYPKPNKTVLNVANWNHITPKEFLNKIKDQASKITNTVILKVTTTPKNPNEYRGNELGIDDDLGQKSLTMYVELYKPTYIANPEKYSLDCERSNVMPMLETYKDYVDRLNPVGYKIINLRKLFTNNDYMNVSFEIGTKNSGNVHLSEDEYSNLIDSLKTTLNNSSIDIGTNLILTQDIVRMLKDTIAEDILCTKSGISKAYFRESSNNTLSINTDEAGKYFSIKVFKKYAKYMIKKGFSYAIPEHIVDGNNIIFKLGEDAINSWEYENGVFKITKDIEGNTDATGEPVLEYKYKKETDKNYGKHLISNNHYILIRSFDKLNEERNGPADEENTYDENGNLSRVVCHTSPWYKLSWYQDFEEYLVDDLDGDASKGDIAKGVAVLPINTNGMTEETKINFIINTSNDRTIINLLGNPSLDFADNRHLISAAYMGSIESFKNSVNDTAGNFGIFTCSSTMPCYTQINFQKTKYSNVSDLGIVISGNLKYEYALGPDETFDKDYDIKVTYHDKEQDIDKTITRINGLVVNFSQNFNSVSLVLPEPLEDNTELKLDYQYYSTSPIIKPGVKRDILGNIIKPLYPDKWGKYTGTGTLDFAMYHTRSKVYWQKHVFSFNCTEETMSKEMYGKSAYTDEYYADKIKITHSVDGLRGKLYDMLTIDTSSLHPYDELIINENFEDDKRKSEDTYVYFPITTQYSPMATSPNSTYGLAIKKTQKIPKPLDDEMAVEIAYDKLDYNVGPIDNIVGEFYLPASDTNGQIITWTCNSEKIKIEKIEEDNIYKCIPTRPKFGEPDEKVIITGTIVREGAQRIKQYTCYIRQEGMSDSQCIAKDLEWLDNLFKNTTNIKEDIQLPEKGPNGSDIMWNSEDKDTIGDSGKVTRPNNGEEAKNVTMNVKVSKGIESQTKEYVFTVIPYSDLEDIQIIKNSISWDTIKGINTSQEAVMHNLVFPNDLGRGVSINWTCTNENVIDMNTGTITRPAYLDGDISCYITAELTKGDVKDYAYIKIIVSKKDITNKECIARALSALTEASIITNNTDLQHVETDLTLPKVSPLEECKTVSFEWEVLKEDKETPDPDNKYAKLNKLPNNWVCSITKPTSSEPNARVALKVTANSSFADGTAHSDTKIFSLTVLHEKNDEPDIKTDTENNQ